MGNENFQLYESLDSTNSEAKRQVLNNGSSKWIIALKQLNGRGRRGKVWHSLSGNFNTSFLFYPPIKECDFYLYSYVAGIAFYDTVEALNVKTKNLCLKWPNDLLINNKKLGGILLENSNAPLKMRKALVIGFGLNLISCPAWDVLGSNALLADKLKNNISIVPEPVDILKILMSLFQKWDLIFLRYGFKRIRNEFLKRTIPIGREIEVKTIKNSTIGKFFGISEDGSLILDCSAGKIFVTAGDVLLIGK